MFIADWGNKRVQVGIFPYFPPLLFLKQGSSSTSLVQEMSLGGEYVRTIGDGVITGNPFGIAASVDTVLVGVDGGTHGIMMFDLTSGTLLRSFGEEGESEGKLLRVRGLRLTLEHVFVAEAGTDRLSVFSLSGDFVRCISLATACGPSDVDITPGGNVLVVCTVSNCVCEYSLDGPSLLRSFGSYGDEPLECKLPVAIATHGDYAFVLEYASARVQIFNPLAS